MQVPAVGTASVTTPNDLELVRQETLYAHLAIHQCWITLGLTSHQPIHMCIWRFVLQSRIHHTVFYVDSCMFWLQLTHRVLSWDCVLLQKTSLIDCGSTLGERTLACFRVPCASATPSRNSLLCTVVSHVSHSQMYVRRRTHHRGEGNACAPSPFPRSTSLLLHSERGHH
jgi:uncharacterized membrane protein